MPLSGQPSVTSSTANGAFQLSSAGSCSLKKAVSAACDGLYFGSIFSIAWAPGHQHARAHTPLHDAA